ncbi:hypothetical protein M8C21_002562 [Ambrosia artemisiifolia]|uniref:Uncharacterized protein n=1 Tax=Ambrosia artemisiifolia TaxID=4212 RepID=A0AAD5BZI9_AMBAR|nr:hypothetical protein M8C21_002562 [Ambrosia artemisiifolia]
MGSLMAGWGSHVHDLQYERNKSLTKEEIASFWRSKKIKEEELFFLKASHRLSKEDKIDVDDGNEPLVKEEDSMEPLLKKHGWWISSKWAFLNEPPNMSWKTPSNYVAQFHIARKHIDSFDLQPAAKGITA